MKKTILLFGFAASVLCSTTLAQALHTIKDSSLSVSPASIETKDLVVTSYNIYPNPAYADANIRFNLSRASRVKISVYNLLGERMKFERQEDISRFPAGENSLALNTSSLPSGVYMVELVADNTRLIKRLSVVK
jgi:hypothetical protein